MSENLLSDPYDAAAWTVVSAGGNGVSFLSDRIKTSYAECRLYADVPLTEHGYTAAYLDEQQPLIYVGFTWFAHPSANDLGKYTPESGSPTTSYTTFIH